MLFQEESSKTCFAFHFLALETLFLEHSKSVIITRKSQIQSLKVKVFLKIMFSFQPKKLGKIYINQILYKLSDFLCVRTNLLTDPLTELFHEAFADLKNGQKFRLYDYVWITMYQYYAKACIPAAQSQQQVSDGPLQYGTPL